MTVDQVVQEANQWPADLVADLVDRITFAKHGGLTEERAAAWADTTARRSGENENGKETLILGQEVSARIPRDRRLVKPQKVGSAQATVSTSS
ncbi:MAG TPA: addiction module antitoxin RelB [Opitutaceae bacterium]|nr:addiction module antitoxin RelB [Opitutaceae bacterium]